MSEIDNVPLKSVRLNGGTQSRVELNQSTIAEYAETIRQGTDLPPVVMFFDGASFWLADGFHRYHAHNQAGAMEIAAEIRTGTQRDAILFSVGANASHGLRRTNDDKRRAVMTLLSDSEWKTWTQAQIATACHVSREYVSRVSASLDPSCDRAQDAVRTVERGGKTYQMDTAKIGRQVESDSTSAAKQTDAPAPTVRSTPQPPIAPEPVVAAQTPAGEVDSQNDDQPDLVSELEAADKEIRRLSQLVATFTEHSDLAQQVAEWSLKFDQLSGRNAQLMRTSSEAQGQARYANDLLAKIRKALGVTANAEILPALTARRTA
jgi:hypothetical protein